MSSITQIIRKSLRATSATSLVVLMSASLPVQALAQDGIIVKGQRVARQQPAQQTAKPSPNLQQDVNVPVSSGTQVTPQAQQPTTGQDQPTVPNSITRPLQLSPPVGTQRVGVRDDLVKLLTVQDAVTMALQNNLTIEQSRIDVERAEFNLLGARGIYDIVSGGEFAYRSQSFPVTSIFQGGEEVITARNFRYNLTTDQLIERTGGQWQVDFTNLRETTSSTASTLTPRYSPDLRFSFTQPLLRNFAIDSNRRQIQVSQRLLDISDTQFRQQVINIINSVQRSYWNLVFAIRNEAIARESVRLTEIQLENNRKMVEAGTLAPIELRSTEAALESRKGTLITALQNITTAENALKNLLLKDANDQLWSSRIEPADKPQLSQPNYSLDEATAMALKNRPELEQLRFEAEQRDIDINFYKNQTKPQVDLFANYGTTGVAGTPSELLSTRVPERFQGGYFQALRNLLGQDFRTYEVGVRISINWRNRTAEANLGRSLAESRQVDARQRQTVQQVQVEVRNALQSVEAARQRFEAARANVLAAQAQYEGELERFRAGLSTNYFVLERQNDLSVAQANETQALTDYNIAVADLQRVTGTTLVSNNVQVTSATARK